MEITLADIGRRFNRDWVFRRVTYQFVAGRCYAILGPNGSGKSTLLQVIASSLTPSKGQIRYTIGDHSVKPEAIYRYISLVAPYMELIEEFTLAEQIRFHFKHKHYLHGVNEQRLMERLGLQHAKDKQIRFFSSGMKQRVKLALACYTDTPMVLLDEPTTNLDHQGVDWYLDLVDKTKGNRLVLVCSNQEKEYGFCEHLINITDYKA
ncbi:ATP-binding cassette domain-containing protein [Parapedobacter sp. ISTM3]|uniref:ABC-type multidrug transport system, ATPase component n=1 Tax=Parapedobacter luteus TaxID=623280 RepID=A0A1T5F9T4_9SPHI|nr:MULTISPECIES: ATP-binding cassette domain-containing protein [Parapedobacter]MBK1442076.1 ATP-binding cassette domain-containing protein [Parapedobacter sp. ISTM3]SKB92933.1 ABC-type multidrug transport system, ATPase component [Parapedobacter luteus]